MKILYTPILISEHKKIEYEFETNTVIVKYDGQTEIFDFSELPEGEAEEIESDVFNFNPIKKAAITDGILYLTLTNYYTADEKTDAILYPDWEEVTNEKN